MSDNKVNNIIFRGMKNSLEAVAKEGKKVAEKVITTQASNNVQATTSNQNQGKILPSLNSPEKVESTISPKQSTPFDNYKPLQPQESLKNKASANEIPPNVSAEAQQFQKYVDNKLIEYSLTGETKLTPLGYQLFTATQPKPSLKEEPEFNNTSSNKEEKSLKGDDILLEKVEENPIFIAGTLKVSDNTEMLTPIQSHIVVGVEQEDNSVKVFAGLTSEKGNKSGIQGVKTTYKLTDNQPISGHQNKGQYARPISPPVKVQHDQFQPHQQATNFVNEPDVSEKLGYIQEETKRYNPVPYKEDGITREHLEMVLELKQNMSELSTKISTDDNEDEKLD